MPRHAPTVNGTPTYKRLSFKYIDTTGDERSDALQIPTATLDADIEALVSAIGAIVNADLYAVEVNSVYNSVPDSTNALNQPRASVYQNLVFLAKDALNETVRGFIPSPVDSLFITGTDEIDPNNLALGGYLTAMLTIFPAYQFVSGRYTERREINERVKF